VLTRNLRNTQEIFRRSQRFYSGSPPMRPAGPPGKDVRLVQVASEQAALDALSKVLHELIAVGAVKPVDVVVLVGRAVEKSFVARREKVGAFRLVIDAHDVLVPEDECGGSAVLVSTVHRFKGLERPVVILVDIEGLDDELMYVGLTRARTHLVVIAESNTLRKVAQET
jgi:superfamily I DNA/RNA helicase